MAKIKLLTTMVSLYNYCELGDIIELKDDTAKTMVDHGIAELVEEEPKKKSTLKKGDK